MNLRGLCKYYNKCVGLESSTTLRMLLKDVQSYIPLSAVRNSVLKDWQIDAFLQNNYEKEKELLVGYPILKWKNWIAPIFMISVVKRENDKSGEGKFFLETEILLNKDIIDRYSTNDKSENIYELRALETALGMDEGEKNFNDLQDLVDDLRAKCPNWEWLDNLNIASLITSRIESNEPDGIHNRAILFAKEATPYTVGLSKELLMLEEVPEIDICHSALGKLLRHENGATKVSQNPLLEVLPMNDEQKEAVAKALHSDVTVISGPPGTGKTQVVANIIINAVFEGQSVLFTSKNNNAVDVVTKRINAFMPELPLVLRYEKNAKVSISEYTQKWQLNAYKERPDDHLKQEYATLYSKHVELKEQKVKVMETRNELDEVEVSLEQYRDKFGNYFGTLSDAEINTWQEALLTMQDCMSRLAQGPKWYQKFFAKKWQRNLEQTYTQKSTLLGELLNQLNVENVLGVDMSAREWEETQNNIKEILGVLQQIGNYNFLLRKLCQHASLEEIDASLIADHIVLQKKSNKLWKNWLKSHSSQLKDEGKGVITDYLSLLEHDAIKNYPKQLNHILPATAITSLSARRRLPFLESIFDLLIIDEASQCDIASMLPMLMRAKRVVIIGDDKQLNHICMLNIQADLKLMQTHDIEPKWSYRSCSIYDLGCCMVDEEGVVKLLNHHRSCSEIIQFSNKEFYNNQLRVATDYRFLKSPNNGTPVQGMQWMNVEGTTIRPEEGGAYNVEEVEGVIRVLRRLADELEFEGTIGVTSPFHHQADLIRKALEADSDLRNKLELRNSILIDTVHKFQGDERDVIIFSPVVSNGTQSQSLAFLKSTGNLFNVAITRARSLLVTVGNREYCKHCKVSYLEHFAIYNTGDEAPVEASEWEHILQEALADAGISVTAQYHVDKFYLDLALFHNGKKLDIEVDGEMYHRAWDMELCYKDQLRNQILMQQGWSVMRFWVQQVRDQRSWCVEKVKIWMQNNK